jgi:hypothetical protein
MAATWQQRELPMLEAIRDAQEAGEDVRLDLLIKRLELDERQVKLTFRRLLDAGYVDAHVQSAADDPLFTVYDITLQEPGLRAVEVWPSEDAYANLITMLEEQLEAETEPEKRSKVKALLVGVTTAGREVVTEVAAAWMRQRIGLS